MKNIFGKFATLLLFASSMATAQVSDPVLLRINGKDIHRSEFEYAYNKNNNNLSDGAQSVEEYLPMFINFKLKVAEAEALHLDTLSSLRAEFQRDRALMAESYLVDEDFIAQEAYSIYANDSATIGKDGFVKFSHRRHRRSYSPRFWQYPASGHESVSSGQSLPGSSESCPTLYLPPGAGVI